jgi:hypothetical protein
MPKPKLTAKKAFQNAGPTAFRLHNQSETFADTATSHVEITKEVLTHVSSDQVDAKYGDNGYPAATATAISAV